MLLELVCLNQMNSMAACDACANASVNCIFLNPLKTMESVLNLTEFMHKALMCLSLWVPSLAHADMLASLTQTKCNVFGALGMADLKPLLENTGFAKPRRLYSIA